MYPGDLLHLGLLPHPRTGVTNLTEHQTTPVNNSLTLPLVFARLGDRGEDMPVVAGFTAVATRFLFCQLPGHYRPFYQELDVLTYFSEELYPIELAVWTNKSGVRTLHNLRETTGLVSSPGSPPPGHLIALRREAFQPPGSCRGNSPQVFTSFDISSLPYRSSPTHNRHNYYNDLRLGSRPDGSPSSLPVETPAVALLSQLIDYHQEYQKKDPTQRNISRITRATLCIRFAMMGNLGARESPVEGALLRLSEYSWDSAVALLLTPKEYHQLREEVIPHLKGNDARQAAESFLQHFNNARGISEGHRQAVVWSYEEAYLRLQSLLRRPHPEQDARSRNTGSALPLAQHSLAKSYVPQARRKTIAGMDHSAVCDGRGL